MVSARPVPSRAWCASRRSSASRRRLGRTAEALAAGLLRRQGAVILARNLVTGGGEIDLLVRFGRQTAVVEVRSVNSSTGVDPLEAFDAAKARQVRKLAATLGCGRIDLVAVRFHPGGVDLHWVRRAA